MTAHSVLIYSSRHCITNGEVFDSILIKSRRHNVADRITGALLIGEGCFVQMLEGERAQVAACFLRITQDTRHCSIQVISAYETDHRQFAEWGMQRLDLSGIRKDLLSPYMTGGVLDPRQVPQRMIEDMFRALSTEYA